MACAAAFIPMSAWGQDVAPVPAQSPRFGDSTWVAPYPIAALEEDPASEGPRVAGPDRNRTGERILRFPFRVAGLPFRWLGRGAMLGGALFLYGHLADKPILPLFDYGSTAGFSGGVRINSPKNSADWTGSLTATLSFKDHRHIELEQRIGRKEAPLGLRIDAGYDYGPNFPFYGIGNSSERGRRSVYLTEEGLVDAFLLAGSNRMRQVRLIGGYSNISVRGGYNGKPSIEEAFDPSDVPFLLEKSRVISYGAAADLASLNDLTFPASGVHGRTEVRRIHGLGDSGVDYLQWHLEGRGYLPVLSDWRTIAVRVVHQGVDPLRGASAVPHYRLPRSADETRFWAFRTDRFRDQQLLLAHVEYRWRLWPQEYPGEELDFASAFVFTQWGAVAPGIDHFRLADGHESHGGGFRFAMKDRAFRLVFARGAEGIRLRFSTGDF